MLHQSHHIGQICSKACLGHFGRAGIVVYQVNVNVPKYRMSDLTEPILAVVSYDSPKQSGLL